jgi:hypothetical protein
MVAQKYCTAMHVRRRYFRTEGYAISMKQYSTYHNSVEVSTIYRTVLLTNIQKVHAGIKPTK